MFAQNYSLISACSDFVGGSAADWPHVLVATTIDSGSVSQGSQTYITSEPSLLLVDQYELEEKIFQMTNSSCW